MTQNEIIETAKQVGMIYRETSDEFANANTDGVDLKTMQEFTKLVLQHYRKATLDTIDALFDSEDPNPMYQIAYNHALIHMQEFIINMEKNNV
jgi:hypothetical protein